MTDREWTARVKRAEENARLLSKLPAMKCGYALRVGGERCKPPVVEYVTSAKDKDKHLLRVEYTDLNEGLKELTRQFKAKYKTI